MRILVTGANGFVGRHVVRALVRTGHRVRGVILPGSDVTVLPGETVEPVEADLCTSNNLPALFDGVGALIHLAALLTGPIDRQRAVTVEGTRRLLTAMAQSATRRLVVVSTFSVYDYQRATTILAEDSPLEQEHLNQRDAYAIVKMEQEQLVRQLSQQHGWELTVLRPGAIWGKSNLTPPGLGPRVGPLQLVISPSAPMRLCYVENCAEAFVKAVERLEAVGQTINLTDDEPVTAWRYTGRLARATGRRTVRVPLPYPILRWLPRAAWAVHKLLGGRPRLPGLLVPRRFDARFKPLRCDNRRLHKILQWSPRFGFDEAMTRATAPAEGDAHG